MAREHGLEARRTPRSGATEFVKGDVQIKTHKWLTGECKRKASLPKNIVEALGDHDFLAMRGDRGQALVVIPAHVYIHLISK